jgi:hypothetical protein
MKRTRNYTGLGAAIAVLAAGMALTVLPARASTPECRIGPLGSYCAILESASGHLLEAPGTKPQYDTPVLGWTDESGDAGSDWAVISSPAATGAVEFVFTPSGAWSGLCASDPGTGYPGNPGYPDGLVLRHCNGSKYQAWTPAGELDGDSDSVLTNVASGLVLTDNGFGRQLGDGVAVASDPAQQWNLLTPG